jgi:hypothetical protein
MVTDIVMSASSIIEKNQYVLKYQDQTLYNHQKQLFTMLTAEDRPTTSKLVLYIAPTGTGKRLVRCCRKTTA